MINYTAKAMLRQHAATFKLPTRKMSNPVQVEKRNVLWTACSGNNTGIRPMFSCHARFHVHMHVCTVTYEL